MEKILNKPVFDNHTPHGNIW